MDICQPFHRSWGKVCTALSIVAVQVANAIIIEGGMCSDQRRREINGTGRTLSLIHISEPTRPLYISYAVFCLKKRTDESGKRHNRNHSKVVFTAINRPSLTKWFIFNTNSRLHQPSSFRERSGNFPRRSGVGVVRV